MKKLLAGFFAGALLITPTFAVNLYVDGAQLQTDVAPTIVHDRTLVPMRPIFEALHASVAWDAATSTASAEKNGLTVAVTIDSAQAQVNEQAHALDVPAQLIGNRTMVPARFVSEALGARVLWDESAQSVYIITPDHASLVVEYLDVGQADSILLTCGGESMLIDAGNNDDGRTVISNLRSAGVSQLKYAVCTHPHEDHIGGMDDVIRAFPVEQVLMADAVTTTKTFSDVLSAIEATNTPTAVPQAGDTLTLGDTTLTVLSAAADADDLNNSSIVLRATYGDTAFLFTGDAETPIENAILQSGALLSCDVLKVGHHGSDTSTSAAFLAAAAPKAAVISCGAGNSYGHPTKSTLEKLSDIPVWRTDLCGTVLAMTDGKNCHLTALGSQTTAPPITQQPATPPTTQTTTTPPATQTTTEQPAAQPATEQPTTEPPAAQPATEQPTESAAQSFTVYVTKTGKRYHYNPNCSSGTYYPATLEEALARGLTPCQKCVG